MKIEIEKMDIVELPISHVSINLDKKTVDLDSVDLKELFNELLKDNVEIAEIMEVLTSGLSDSEYGNLIYWLDENYDFSEMIKHLEDVEREETILQILLERKKKREKKMTEKLINK